MSHDVFISHSSLDKTAADAVCHGLEAKGVRCWIAPRDQIAGKAYGEQISEAIRGAAVMVLVFSEHVNQSQAVLNEINLAASANVTIVPFRIASVEFNPELNYYLGRTHWLDAFPQPIADYIDTLAATVQRNLPQRAAAEPTPAPAPPPAPSPPAAQDRAEAVVVPQPPPPTDYLPLMIVGGLFGVVLLVGFVLSTAGHRASPANQQAANTIMQAVANAIQEGAKGDQPAPAQAPTLTLQNAHGDGAELNAVRPANPAAVNYYETVLAPGGPPAALEGATVISTTQLIQSMRERDAGANPFWLIDARGCTNEPTIPTSVCLTSNTLGELEAKAPDRATQLVMFCHDGACPMSYSLAVAAVAAGYSNVFWYRGGINAWAAAGEPTVNRAGAPS